MKVFIFHNFYQVPGGEDSVVASEVDLLRKRGHEVIEHYVHNDSIKNLWRKTTSLLGMIFSPRSYWKTRRLLRKHRPDVLHAHNLFPLLSPSVIYAANHEKIPIVITLHNFRTICPTVVLMHNGNITERSIESGPWWALRHRVYRNSFVGTLGLCTMIWLHKKLGTWKRTDKLITLTDFARRTFVRTGIAPESRFVIKPNFVDYIASSPTPKRKPFILYVGRISPEKGVDILLEACRQIEYRCVIITPQVIDLPNVPDNVEFHEALQREDVLSLMRQCTCLVVPSTCYEGFPMVIAEAFSTSTPVICSKLGGLPEIVKEGKTGLHFTAGNANQLAQKIDTLLKNPQLQQAMGHAAKRDYGNLYCPQRNAEILEQIYVAARKKR